MRFVQKLVLALIVAFLVAGAPAAAAKDRREIRARGTCTGPGHAELRLRAEEGRLRIDFHLEDVGNRSWSVIVLHERRTAARRAVRSEGGELEFRSTVPDWFGTDTVSVRATAATGASCRASATL